MFQCVNYGSLSPSSGSSPLLHRMYRRAAETRCAPAAPQAARLYVLYCNSDVCVIRCSLTISRQPGGGCFPCQRSAPLPRCPAGKHRCGCCCRGAWLTLVLTGGSQTAEWMADGVGGGWTSRGTHSLTHSPVSWWPRVLRTILPSRCCPLLDMIASAAAAVVVAQDTRV